MVEKSHTAGWWPNVYEPFRQMGERVADWFAPRSEASALEDYYEINVELPGVKTEDVEVTMEGNSLEIRGEKRSETQDVGQSYYFSEREYGAFQRTFRLPSDAKADTIDATFSDGVLQIKIAKDKPSKRKPQTIEIRKA